MPRPYSMDLQDRAVARVMGGETVRSVAAVLAISVASVVKWSQRFRMRRRPRVFVAPRRGWPAMPMACANKPGIAHQASDPLAAMRLPMIAQLSMNTRCAVCLARTRAESYHSGS